MISNVVWSISSNDIVVHLQIHGCRSMPKKCEDESSPRLVWIFFNWQKVCIAQFFSTYSRCKICDNSGWDALSYGYHGDDGNFFSASGQVIAIAILYSGKIQALFDKYVKFQGVAYGPTFGKGDVIGCGLNLVRKNVFFTKNGENLGEHCYLISWSS